MSVVIPVAVCVVCLVAAGFSFRLAILHKQLACAYQLVADMLRAPDRETQAQLAEAEQARLHDGAARWATIRWSRSRTRASGVGR